MAVLTALLGVALNRVLGPQPVPMEAKREPALLASKAELTMTGKADLHIGVADAIQVEGHAPIVVATATTTNSNTPTPSLNNCDRCTPIYRLPAEAHPNS